MKLLAEMDLSPRWLNLLADAGFEAARCPTLGANNALDTEIMAVQGRRNVKTRPYYSSLSSEVHWGHRVALMAMADKQ